RPRRAHVHPLRVLTGRAMRDALLAAVCEAPDEDAPRLVYADWLEEHGDEDDQARAEFIRGQIALEGMAADHPDRDALRPRRVRLEREHGAGWLAELPDWAAPLEPQEKVGRAAGGSAFWRGFLDQVGATVEDWIHGADDLVAAHPICRAVLREGEGRTGRLA